GVLVVPVVAAILGGKGLAPFAAGFTPSGPAARRRLCSPPPQHPCNAQILVEVGPVDAQRHDLEIRALLGRSALEPRVPIERRCNFAAVSKGYDQLRRGEFDRAGMEVADVNFQSSHSRLPIAARDLTASGE